MFWGARRADAAPLAKTAVCFGLFLVGVAPAFAGTIPAIPRVIISIDEPMPTTDEDPVALAERIAKQAKAVRDKLADADTGPTTQDDQKKLKQDIDALIRKLENPPPNDNKSEADPPPTGGASEPPPPMGGGNPPPPQGGRSGRKPRGEKGTEPPTGGEPKPTGGEPKPTGGEPKPMGAKPGEPMSPAGAAGPGQAGTATPSLPLEESIARDFWGHLPDAPRQKMLQFYREQYMSKYKDLLPKYYEALAEKDRKAKK